MIKGKAWKYGDDVDTDVIIPAKYLTSSDPEVLKAHCMEGLDEGFAGKVAAGDIVVAGNNFGCGSSREHAPLAIKAAGVSCLIAKSFARIFFRNSFNIGLPILESAEAADGIEPGDNLEVDLAAGLIRNTTKGKEYKARPLPEFMQTLVTDGGLIGYVKRMMEEGQLKAGTDEEPPVEKAEEKKGPGARMKEIEEEEKPEGVDAPWVEEEPEEEKAAKTGDDEDDMDEDEDDEDDEDEEESEK